MARPHTLEIQSGSTVGEIGAGSGELTVALAKVVGETGRNAADIAAHIRTIFEVEPETFSDVGVER